jgi:hypothetical protein
MRAIFYASLFVICVSVLAGTSVLADVLGIGTDSEECEQAVQKYNAAIPAVTDSVRAYAKCFSGSNGHNDCSTEFSRLRDAQEGFAIAVSDYKRGCGIAPSN